MTRVFIGGSRRISRLSPEVKKRLDRIIENGFAVLIGDAAGADSAIQKYLHSLSYQRVEVFCTNGQCRHNLGGWPVRSVHAPRAAKGFAYFSVKDELMSRESSIGFMLWDGKSRGTSANIARLLDAGKKVVVYFATGRKFVTLSSHSDWEGFLVQRGKSASGGAQRHEQPSERRPSKLPQVSLF